MFCRIERFIRVSDPEGDIIFNQMDLLKYSGPRGVIASGLILRLFERAFFDISPYRPPVRHKIKVLSSFKGPDVIDGIELVTKAVRSGRFILDPEKAPLDAPIAPNDSCMYFEVAYGKKAFGYTFSPDIFDTEWFVEVQAHEKGCKTAQEHAKYIQFKFQVLAKLLTSPDPFLRAEPCGVDPRFPS